MKKIISIILSVCIFFCMTGALAGCGERCSHSWNLKSDTATCADDGVKTYECDLCGEIKMETSSALEHDWKQISSTATCVSDGITTYKCNNCNKTKQEPAKAIGHSYSSWGECSVCGQFKYDISLSVSLPKTFSYVNDYTSHCYSKCQITKVNFEIKDDYLVVFYYGTKIYEASGAYGSESVIFTSVLKDLSGNIIASDNIYILGLDVNQQFGEDGYYGKKFCKTSSLLLNKKYVLEILDRRI